MVCAISSPMLAAISSKLRASERLSPWPGRSAAAAARPARASARPRLVNDAASANRPWIRKTVARWGPAAGQMVRPGASVTGRARSWTMTRPLRPVPARVSSATPWRRARRRAAGEARRLLGGAAVSVRITGMTVVGAALAGRLEARAPGAGASPSTSMSAMAPSTGTRSPALARWARKMPSVRAGTSTTVLSVSHSSRVSPRLKASPGCFSQAVIRPSSMVSPRRGSAIWVRRPMMA